MREKQFEYVEPDSQSHGYYLGDLVRIIKAFCDTRSDFIGRLAVVHYSDPKGFSLFVPGAGYSRWFQAGEFELVKRGYVSEAMAHYNHMKVTKKIEDFRHREPPPSDDSLLWDADRRQLGW